MHQPQSSSTMHRTINKFIFKEKELKKKKMVLLRCFTQYVNKFGKLSSGHRSGKGQFSSQSQRRPIPENVQTHTIVLISHACKVMLKILQVRL